MKSNPPSRLLKMQRWFLRRIYRARAATIDRRRGRLVYVGMHLGREFDLVFRNYRECFGFEANPDLFSRLVEKYRSFPHVRLFNYAVGDRKGPVTLNVSNNGGASSSLGNFDEDWQRSRTDGLRMDRSITVEGVNLYQFCLEQGIDTIDDYISDIQGMDLQVLKSLAPMIEQRRIGTITVETTHNSRRNIYRDLPDNSEAGFEALLGRNYKLVATGYGILADYWFADYQADSWEIDCKWRLR